MRESRFLWLSANVLDRRTRRPFGGAWPWLVRELGTARVGVVGLTIAETQHTSNVGPDVTLESPRTAARAAFDAMGPVDVRLAVTHLELREDRALAETLPLHVILGGHDHDPITVEQRGTLILKAGSDAQNLAQVELDVACGAVQGRRHRLIPVDGRLAEAPDVARFVARYAALTEKELDQPAATLAAPLEARDVALRSAEQPIGRFVAEAMRVKLGADAALLNSGALRANRVFPAGVLRRRDVRALLPFGNTVMLLEVTGADLRLALERSTQALPAPAGRFLQTAGLTYAVDPARPPGSRIGAITVGGQPLAIERRYRIALPEYLARGGDGYDMLARGRVEITAEEGPGLIDTVLGALSEGRLP